ncbi:hypothetical protein GI582_06985 [Sulfitobacter sp. BDSS02]|nr:hypothetical protein [Sulfitobacter sp. BDSS02]
MSILRTGSLQDERDFSYKHAYGSSYIMPFAIDFTSIKGKPHLLASGVGGGIAVVDIAGSGKLSVDDVYLTNRTPDDLGRYMAGSKPLSFTKGGKEFALLATHITEPGTPSISTKAIVTIKLNASGAPVIVDFEATDPLTSYPLNTLKIGKKDVVYTTTGTTTYAEDVVTTYKIAKSGRIKELAATELEHGMAYINDTVTVGGKAFLVSSKDLGPELQVHQFKRDGSLIHTFDAPHYDGAIERHNVSDIETVEIGKRGFAVVTEDDRGRAVVYEVDENGELLLVDQVIAADDWVTGADAGVLRAFEFEGVHYVAAGGFKTPLVIFQMSERGALTRIDSYDFGPNSEEFILQLDEAEIGGKQFLFSLSGQEDSVQSFEFKPESTVIEGSNTNDTISGTGQNDQITGLDGKDRIDGGNGDDAIDGGNGKDKLIGRAGGDSLFGGDGNDKLKGGGGDDFLIGDDGSDKLYGQGGNDMLDGREGDDTLIGGGGDDFLFGRDGDDLLKGASGEDTLIDGAGEDILYGGTDRDHFVFIADGETDYIRDFDRETIDLTHFGTSLTYDDLSISNVNERYTIGFANEVLIVDIIIQNQYSNLNESHFLFAT